MKKIALLLSLFFFVFPAFSQEENTEDPLEEENNLIIQSRLNQANNISGSNSNSIVYGFDNRDSAPKGDVYLFDDWTSGEVTFHEGSEVKELFLNVDLFNQLLEIKTEKAVKVAKEDQVKRFTILRSGEKKEYISLNGYRADSGEKVRGFAEVLFDDKVALVKRPYIYVKETKYIPGLEVGSPIPELKNREEFFIVKDQMLMKVHRKMKFGEHDQEIKKYMKENKLRLKREENIKDIVQYYNSLL